MPKRGPAPGATAESRVLILLEDIQQKVKASNEGIASLRAELITRMDRQFESLKSRIDVLELAVRKNSEDIRKNSEDIRKNSEDIRKNSETSGRTVKTLPSYAERSNG